jgi:hypothetical protein
MKHLVDDNDGEWLLRGKGREQAEQLLRKIVSKKQAR